MRRKLEQQQGLLDEPAEMSESDFLESIARTIFRKGGGLLGELLNPKETGLDEGYLDDQGRLVVTEPLVRERNFRNWFGDSKVVDEEGKPLVVYHGTTGDIKAFNLRGRNRTGGKGYFFATNPDFASAYAAKGEEGGAVYPVYLKSEKLFDGSNADHAKEIESAIDKILKREALKPYGKGQDFYPYSKANAMEGIRKGAWHWMEHPIVNEALRRAKFDGAVMREGKDVNYMMFSPNQIKSIHNRGTYNPDDPDLLGMNTMNMSLLYG